ncbi:SapC family protein [Bordetella sp. LUAb4]|uniref:SapC family protein n=1 Tax=Bordetella sp. LUAb4 TaxID=2843195 RepID=UPI001E5E5D35|nr:SapC family protein [Bordetella sp. LUAb4]
MTTNSTTNSLPLFYVEPRPLNANLHGNLSLSGGKGFAYAAKTNAVPLVATELPTACRHFPIVFTDGPQPAPVAVLGVRAGENLFVGADGKWREGTYIPAYIRRYPFIFTENADRSQFTLCVDEAADAVVEGRDNPFFDEAGEPTALARSALDFCRDYQNQHAFTTEFATALAEADLLVENRADITLADGQRLALSGFKVVDEAKFNKLPDETFLRWRANGWLPLVYCHLLSINTWPALINQLQPAGEGEAK